MSYRSVAWLWVVLLSAPSSYGAPLPPVRFWEVASAVGADLPCLDGRRAEHVGLIACRKRCEPIPWQLDERDRYGRLVLDAGLESNADDRAGVIDGNDEVLWMVADSGRRMRAEEIPRPSICGLEIRHTDKRGFEGWVYAFALPTLAGRSERDYVRYDPESDRVTTTYAVLGYGGPAPRYLAETNDGSEREVNLLDRLKVSGSARFLGIVPIHRDEGDITSERVGWRDGAVRVTRYQRAWFRLGFGIRSPTLHSEARFHAASAELPLEFHLNFPATYFFSPIQLQAVLDFRDLKGWRILAEGLNGAPVVGSTTRRQRAALSRLRGDWFALQGPRTTFVQTLAVSPSLATVMGGLVYREGTAARGPEDVQGEMPAIGYELSGWRSVGSGEHGFTSTSYAFPADYDLPQFSRERRQPATIEIRQVSIPRD